MIVNPEILAPAGGCEELKSAVLHGADAVYFGVSSFNARLMADNFTTDNLSEWVDYCHFFDVKVYLTLNTVIKNTEIPNLVEVITTATKANVDAFIVCDLATLELCNKIAPSIPIHLSTQFGVHNYEGAIYAKKLGAKRVILSRETPLSEIKRIKDSGLEVEVFVHGALCVSFSGNCYLSSAIDGNSGNRGRCKQPCRKKYRSSLTGEIGYYLSTNDLCLAGEVEALRAIGVDSFKIEGRLKSPEYVSATIRLYKKALDNKDYTREIDDVKATFARTFTTKGYLYGNNDGIINPNLQNSAGLKVGNVSTVTPLKNGLNKVTFKSNRNLSVGDGIKFVRRGQEVGGATISLKGDEYEVYLKASVIVGDFVCLTKPKSLKYEPTVDVNVKLVEISEGEYTLTIYGESESTSVNFSTSYDQTDKDQINGIKGVLAKGSAPFVLKNVEVKLLSNRFLPYSTVNSERKRCFLEYKKQVLLKYQKQQPRKVEYDLLTRFCCENKTAVILSSYSGVDIAINNGYDVIYAPYDYSECAKFFDKIEDKRIKVYFALPTISFEKDLEVLYKTIEKYNTCMLGLYGNNVFLNEVAQKFNLPVFKGHGFNVTNNLSKRLGESEKVTLSPELSQVELDVLDTDGYVYALGYLPLMTLAHCPAKSNGFDCSNCPFDKRGEVSYSDKMKKFYLKRVRVDRCYFELYSDKPILNTDKNHNILLDLRRFSPDEVEKVLKKGYNGSVNNKYCTKGVL